MRSRWILSAAAAALAAAFAALLLLSRGDGRPAAGSRLRILFTGETLGELEPCDCSGMAGGLPRRGGYVLAQPGERLLLETGCVGNGARDFEVLRAEAALRGMKAMGYDAVNVGEHELWLGIEGLRKLQGAGVPFVSANVLDEKGEPAAARSIIRRVSGLQVAVTGVAAQGRYDPGPGLKVEPPEEALGRLIPELAAEAGAIVLLADLDLAAAKELAGAFPEISAILFRGRGDSHPPEKVSRSIVASIYGEARYVGDLTLLWDADRRISAERGEAVLLDGRFPPSDAVKAAAIDWYKAAVQGKIFDLRQAGRGWDRLRPFEPEPGNGYVGSEACKRCHPRQHEVWSREKHSRALESLLKDGSEWSPECIVCHVVGYGSSSGYVSRAATPGLGQVGCEACHGPGKALLGGKCRGIARRGGEASCRECHTARWDPGFVYEEDWKRIDHSEAGKK